MLLPISLGDEKVETSATHYISMSAQLLSELYYCVDHYKTEVSGCGMVERIEHRYKSDDKDEPDTVQIEFKITELYLPTKQDNSAGSTDIDEDTIAELMHELLSKGKNTEHLRLHWHSHADMDTFHSGTDEDNYATLSNGEFLVSLVVNKAHKILGRVDYFSPIRVTMSGIAVYCQTFNECKPSKEMLDSVEALDKYTKEKPVTKVYTGGLGAGYSGYGGYADEYSGYDAKDNNDKKYKGVWLTQDEMELCKIMRIPFNKAKKYKACNKADCSKCNDMVECNEFEREIGGYYC